MLNSKQLNEIHKYFLNALKAALSSKQSRQYAAELDPLISSRTNSPSLKQQAEQYGITIYEMKILSAACKKATSDTQAKIDINADNIEEITQAITSYQATIIPDLVDGYDYKQQGTEPWQTILNKIDLLDSQIEIPGFFEKYNFEIKTVGLVLGIAAFAGLTLWAASSMGGGDESIPNPSNYTI